MGRRVTLGPPAARFKAFFQCTAMRGRGLCRSPSVFPPHFEGRQLVVLVVPLALAFNMVAPEHSFLEWFKLCTNLFFCKVPGSLWIRALRSAHGPFSLEQSAC